MSAEQRRHADHGAAPLPQRHPGRCSARAPGAGGGRPPGWRSWSRCSSPPRPFLMSVGTPARRWRSAISSSPAPWDASRLLDRAGHLHLAAGQHDQVGGDPLELGEHVRGEHDRDVVLAGRLDDRGHEVVPGHRVERGQRLVEHQQARPAGQRDRQRELRLLPAGERRRPSAAAGCRAVRAGRRRGAGPSAGSGCGRPAACRRRAGSGRAARPGRRRRSDRARRASPPGCRRARSRRPRWAWSGRRPW